MIALWPPLSSICSRLRGPFGPLWHRSPLLEGIWPPPKKLVCFFSFIELTQFICNLRRQDIGGRLEEDWRKTGWRQDEGRRKTGGRLEKDWREMGGRQEGEGREMGGRWEGDRREMGGDVIFLSCITYYVPKGLFLSFSWKDLWSFRTYLPMILLILYHLCYWCSCYCSCCFFLLFSAPS